METALSTLSDLRNTHYRLSVWCWLCSRHAWLGLEEVIALKGEDCPVVGLSARCETCGEARNVQLVWDRPLENR